MQRVKSSSGRVVIVIHDPGKQAGYDIVRDVVARIKNKLRAKDTLLDVHVETISLLEENNSTITSGDLVYGLFLARGGHWQTIEDHVSRENAILLGKPSPGEIGRLLSKYTVRCDTVSVVYWPAKRYRERHYADTLEFAREVAGGKRLLLLEPGRIAEAEGCIVIASMMPGRLIDRAIDYGKTIRIPYIMFEDSVRDYIAGDVVDKILGRVSAAHVV